MEEDMSELLTDYLMNDFDVIENQKLDSSFSIIMDRLTESMDTVSYDYKVTIIRDSQVNAFTSLNGQLYVFTGLIEKLDHAEEMALILAHEIGHAENKHVIEKMVKIIGMETLFSIATGGDPVLISELAKLSISTAFDRKNEEEADDYALELAIKSRLNPRRLGQFFLKMKQHDHDIIPDIEIIQTHPMNNDRIKKSAEKELPEDFKEESLNIDWSLVQNYITE